MNGNNIEIIDNLSENKKEFNLKNSMRKFPGILIKFLNNIYEKIKKV